MNCSGLLFVFFQQTCATTSTEKLVHFHTSKICFFSIQKIAEVSSYTMISISLMLQLGLFFVFSCGSFGEKNAQNKRQRKP